MNERAYYCFAISAIAQMVVDGARAEATRALQENGTAMAYAVLAKIMRNGSHEGIAQWWAVMRVAFPYRPAFAGIQAA